MPRLDRFEAGLLGKDDGIDVAKPLRAVLAARKLPARHALDLLYAFRMKTRYANFDELMHYCAYSAAPVGRYVLDVHGESETTWPANDALCSALQIINHTQDCGADYRNLDRVYIPQDAMARYGTDVTALAAPAASPNLLACLHELSGQTEKLVALGRTLSPQVKDLRLALETAVIGRLAQTLVTLLQKRDPLSAKVHLNKPEVLGWTLLGVSDGFMGRIKGAPRPASAQTRRA